MTTIALVLFVVAALGGAFLAVRHFKGQSLPMPVSLLHGLLAASGLSLLFIAYFNSASPENLVWALILLVAAALGGFGLFSFHLRSLKPPSAVVVLHALAAVVGVVALALVVL